MLRATYYAQELLSTFSTAIGEVALVPATGGIFIVDIDHAHPTSLDPSTKDIPLSPPAHQTTRLWDRKTEGGFPETKQLKRLIRDIIEPTRDLGHVDRVHPSKTQPPHPDTTTLGGQSPANQLPTSSDPSPRTVTAQAAPETTTSVDTGPTPKVGSQSNNNDDQHPQKVTRTDPDTTGQAEKMVEDIMTVFRSQNTHYQSTDNDDQERKETPAEAAAREKAERMVDEIMASFRDGTHDGNTKNVGVPGEKGKGQKQDEEQRAGEVGSVNDSTKPVCEDCE
ncbi:MAG: hypothetical protein Q9220_001421 [cf. Caloplaca sp. 1 TL-2023]